MFIPVVFLEAGASETLVCSRAKRAQSELEALIAPRRVEGSQRNFLDSLPTPYSVNHLTEKTRLYSKKNRTKENEPNVIDPEGIRHGVSPVAGWVGGKKNAGEGASGWVFAGLTSDRRTIRCRLRHFP